MNCETIRALADIELIHVAAGIGDDTGDTTCIHVNIVKSPPGG